VAIPCIAIPNDSPEIAKVVHVAIPAMGRYGGLGNILARMGSYLSYRVKERRALRPAA